MNGFCVLVDHKSNKIPDHVIFKTMIQPIVSPGIGKVKFHFEKGIAIGVYDQFIGNPERLIYKDENLLVVCDAEVYNFNEISKYDNIDELSEAKAIADLYHKNGVYWYKNVQGVFSAFIWDYKTKRGYAYSDRIGTKPVRYFSDNSVTIIASSIKSIIAYSEMQKELDYQAIFSYLSMEMIPTPYTIFKNINKLESGHVLNISNKGIDITILWKMQYPEEKISDQKELESKIFDITKRSISQITAYRNKPEEIGSFLSGGTDSSTIAGLLSERHPGKVNTFSIGFDEEGYDEMYYARIAAKAFNTNHTEYYITIDDIVDSLPKIIEDFDEPFANSSVIPAYFCSKIAYDRGIKTMLGGDGGDEIFGGNARYHKYFADFQKIPSTLVNFFYPFFIHLPNWSNKSIVRKVNNYIKRAKGILSENIQAFDLYNYMDPNNIFEKDFLKLQVFVYPKEITQKYIDQAGINDKIDQYLYHDLKITLMDNDLPKVNRMTQLANVNIRYPFLYPELVEYTGFIPSNLKVHNGKLRYIFKESFKNLLPDDIINKQKHGFGLPIVPWILRPGKLNDILKDIIFNSRTHQRGIFQKKFLETLYARSKKDSTTFYGTYLYYILIMEMWLREHYDEN